VQPVANLSLVRGSVGRRRRGKHLGVFQTVIRRYVLGAEVYRRLGDEPPLRAAGGSLCRLSELQYSPPGDGVVTTCDHAMNGFGGHPRI
jgi:hypothetical protein